MKGDSGPENEGSRGESEGMGAYLRYLPLGTQMALIMVIGVFAGIWLDGKLNASPAFTVAGAVLGIGLGIAVVVREVGRDQK